MTSVGRASGRSTLLMTTIGFSPTLSALETTNLVCGSGPSAASTSTSAPSTMFRMRSTSPENRDPLFRIALLKPGILARDDASSNRHPAPSFLFEHDPFGKPVPTFPDHAPGAQWAPKRKPGQKDRAHLTRCAAIYSEN